MMRKKMWISKCVIVWFSLAACVPSPLRVRTPETRTLTPQEAAGVLERDWLFQAMGEPLLPRTELCMQGGNKLCGAKEKVDCRP